MQLIDIHSCWTLNDQQWSQPKIYRMPQEVSIEFKVDDVALYCIAVLEYVFVTYIKPHF